MRILLLSVFLVIVSCRQEVNPTTEPTTTTVDEIPEKLSSVDEDERSNWQKPEFIIGNMGSLEGKTIADIGSGAFGYFVFKLLGQTLAERVIAIDIDPEAVQMLKTLRNALDSVKSERLDIRLAEPNNPMLNDNEVDVILIVNTISYIEDRVNYLKLLKSKLKDNGKLLIIDFKMKRIPEYVEAPPYGYRTYLNVIEEELYEAEFSNIVTNDTELEFQYFISAVK